METSDPNLLPMRPGKVAYFSMEIALQAEMPTYSGGLGVLAGDTLRSAADLGVSMVGVTLLYRKGYFRQKLDAGGHQTEEPEEWDPSAVLEPVNAMVTVTIEGRPVYVRCWQYSIYGINGHLVPVYLLDTGIPTNNDWTRTLTDHLYGGDAYYRLCQEYILGMGGVQMLEHLGHSDVALYHMNEGHSALLVLRLLEQQLARSGLTRPSDEDLRAIRSRCVFTTHTPVPAGHDKFSGDLMRKVIGPERTSLLFSTGFSSSDSVNMTHLALHHSNYVNGVAMKHGEVSREMFPKYRIKALTNGVHARTFASPAIRELFDREIPEWRHDNVYLRYAINIPPEEILNAHLQAKRDLLAAVAEQTGVQLDETAMTIGFARRATAYKRAGFLFSDIPRLKRMTAEFGPLQIVYGGKAHPRDQEGKALIRSVFAAKKALEPEVKLVYVENYDMNWGLLITSGADLWLNTPEKTREASGTSGMKAALNGVPSLSVLDGWWVEGHIEGVTGWSIDDEEKGLAGETDSLYGKLEKVILPMYYKDPIAYAKIMRSAIALNAMFFNTQRMVIQYIFNAYSSDGRR